MRKKYSKKYEKQWGWRGGVEGTVYYCKGYCPILRNSLHKHGFMPETQLGSEMSCHKESWEKRVRNTKDATKRRRTSLFVEKYLSVGQGATLLLYIFPPRVREWNSLTLKLSVIVQSNYNMYDIVCIP